MGTTRDDGSQQSMWVATGDLPQSAGHPFYERLNRVLSAAGFDAFVEDLCREVLRGDGAAESGPGSVFSAAAGRVLRGAGLGAGDCVAGGGFAERAFVSALVGAGLASGTIRRFRGRGVCFRWRLTRRCSRGYCSSWRTLVWFRGRRWASTRRRWKRTRRCGRSCVGTRVRTTRRFWRVWRRRPASTRRRREELARFDRKRKKKMSNEEWTHPHDPDSKIAKMKDGSTHMAHRWSMLLTWRRGAVVGVTLQGAEKGDTETVVETAVTAAEQVEEVLPEGSGVAEMVADKGYHSNETLVGLAAVGVRSYISEPDRGRRSWKDHPEAQEPVYGNRRRIRGKRGRRLLRSRGEVVERTFAHAYETGGMRRVHLRGYPNILKRLLVHVAGLNLGCFTASPDRGRHSPEPAGAGCFRHLRCDRGSERPLGASDGFLGRQLAAGGSHRLNRSSPSRLNASERRPDFFHGLTGVTNGMGLRGRESFCRSRWRFLWCDRRYRKSASQPACTGHWLLQAG